MNERVSVAIQEQDTQEYGDQATQEDEEVIQNTVQKEQNVVEEEATKTTRISTTKEKKDYMGRDRKISIRKRSKPAKLSHRAAPNLLQKNCLI